MKILQLSFQNLNSLYGKWTIDFTAPEFLANGIFAIVGPTGAGKSTILDAVCLALYGATPRLGKITQTNNEIMSRQTGDCFAEIVFESQEGKYRCHWSQQRARKKPDGALQDAKHEIAEADTGKILENKRSLVGDVVVSKTGMDFKRFTRSILLAQGSFAAFLQATPDERSPILEQITGTQIYSDISIAAFERCRSERERLSQLQADIAGIQLLSDDEKTVIQTEQDSQIALEKTLSAELVQTLLCIQWLTTLEKLKNELSGLQVESEKLSAISNAFAVERDKLHKGQLASQVEVEYTHLNSCRRQKEEERLALQKNQELLPDVTAKLQQCHERHTSAEGELVRTKEALEAKMPLLKRVRLLDAQIAEKRNTHLAAQKEFQDIEKAIVANVKEAKQTKKQSDELEMEAQRADAYFSANTQDATLAEQMTGIIERLKQLQQASGVIVKLKASAIEEKKKVTKAVTNFEKKQKELNDLKQEHELLQREVVRLKHSVLEELGGRLLREYRTEHEFLLKEQALRQKIANYEDERKQLEDGKPCLLCGSCDHPYALGNIPELNETQKRIQSLTAFIVKIEALETKIQESETAERKASDKMKSVETKCVESGGEKKAAEDNFARIMEELASAEKYFTELNETALAVLRPFAVTVLMVADVDSVVAGLEERLRLWNEHRRKKEDCQARLGKISEALKIMHGTLEMLEQSKASKRIVCDVQQTELETVTSERTELLGKQTADDVERGLNAAIGTAEKALAESRASRDQARQKLEAVKTLVDDLQGRLARRVPELEAAELVFTNKLHTVGFTDEKAFCDSRLTAETIHHLLQEDQALKDKGISIQTRIRETQARLDDELKKQLTEKTVVELEVSKNELHAGSQRALQAIGACKQKLADDVSARTRIHAKQTAIAAQEKEHSRWDLLSSLIGSRDGKKFRNFAQGLTFERMVVHANKQLEKMTDRYLLCRDETQPLDLNVIDNYQAGEVRSTKNLSGGESFIVSLALALGLSKMSSRTVRVDSLFLDEGFGTLDEDALETALAALSGLHLEGKLIGVISHVQALKERISVQIAVQPTSAGRSVLQCPGSELEFGN